MGNHYNLDSDDARGEEMKKLTDLIRECGSPAATARKYDIPVENLYRWMKGGKIGLAWRKVLEAEKIDCSLPKGKV